ncbi:MAG: acyl carrier protein [Kordiimonadaceae bacterium]|nr:acyl carrier protein [Kordiimonadaceae bacterium]
MADAKILEKISAIITPINRKGVALTGATTFAVDLEFDSLTVMDMVADIEDEFDIILPLNLLPDLETIQHLVDAVEKILSES